MNALTVPSGDEWFDLIERVHTIEEELVVHFDGLAASPGLYLQRRPALDRLSEERRDLLVRLGERAAARDTRPVEEPAPSTNLASTEQVRAFTQEFGAKDATPVRRAQTADQPRILRSILREACSVDEANGRVTVGALQRLTDTEALARLRLLAPEIQVECLELVTGWLRHAQESGAEDDRAELDEVFARLRKYQADVRPGFVFGMALTHKPRGESWADDARALHEELSARVPSEAAATRVEPAEATPASSAPKASSAGQFSGLRVAMFGGSVREQQRRSLHEACGFETLDWVEGGKPTKVDSLCQRTASGRYDLVVVTRFASHEESNKLIDTAKSAGVRFAVTNGYGKSELLAALEVARLRR